MHQFLYLIHVTPLDIHIIRMQISCLYHKVPPLYPHHLFVDLGATPQQATLLALRDGREAFWESAAGVPKTGAHYLISWVVWNMILFFHTVENFIIPIDFHIFQRGRYATNQ